jgi:predicted alpha/beta hydrolase
VTTFLPVARPSHGAGPVEDVRFASSDGYPLAGTLFQPALPNGVAVLVNPAYAIPRGYYRHYARHLASLGFLVLSYDYRGVGGSRAPAWRGPPERQTDWGERDCAAAIEWLAARAPDLRLVAVGHSAGGYLPGLAASNTRLRGLLTVATQSGYWRLRDGWRAPFSWLFFHLLLPAATELARRWPALARGPFAAPAEAAREWARWGRQPHYFSDEHGAPLRFAFDRFTAPVRAYGFADDPFYAPPRAVEAVRGFYARAPVEIVHRAPADYGVARIGHFGFFRADMPRAAWDETARWLLAAAAQ